MVTIIYNCCKTPLRTTLLQSYSVTKCQKLMESTDKIGIRKSLYKRDDVKKIRMNILTRYIEYVKNYDKVIESKFPTAMHLYRTFKIGIGEFYRDLKNYISIIRKLNTQQGGIKNLNVGEIELYHRMPRDMIKIAPVLIISALPLTNYIIFPLTYYFPRQLLCHHFWTLQQRSEFQMYYLKTRLLNNKPTFRSLQLEIPRLKKKKHPLFQDMAKVLGILGSGNVPTATEIIKCKDLFIDKPYGIDYMQPGHVKALLKVHGMSSSIWFRRVRLEDRARLILAMDRAILRENGPSSLSNESLRFACILRGLNPAYADYDHMVKWLDTWLEVSKEVTIRSASLLLHCPILLGYNQPSNWRIIY